MMKDPVERQSAIAVINSARIDADDIQEFHQQAVEALKALPSVQIDVQLPTRIELDMAYMRGKIDGIRECTENLRKVRERLDESNG